MKASDNAYPSVLLVDTVAPASPPAGKLRLYVEGGALKLVDETGAVIGVGEVSAADFDTLQGEVDALETGKANTSHTQPSSSISDFAEAVQDVLGAALIGSGVTVSYNDSAGTVTITGLATTDAEAVRDAIGIALVGVGAITVTVNDATDTITIATTATDRSTHTGTQTAATISDLTEVTQDTVANQITAGAGMTKTYDDTTGLLTLTSTASGGLDLEAVQDAVAAMIVAGSNVTKTYDDTAGTLTIASSGSGGGGGGTAGLWRGPWVTLAVASTLDFSSGIPAAVTVVSGGAKWSAIATPSGPTGTPPVGGFVLQAWPVNEVIEATFVVPAGCTAVRLVTAHSSGNATFSQLSIAKNGVVQYGPYWVTAWTPVSIACVAGDVIALRGHDNANFTTKASFGQIEFLAAAAPYMTGHTVTYANRIWRSAVDNNVTTPGASPNWVEEIIVDRMPYVFSDGRTVLVAGAGTQKVPNATGRTLTLKPVRLDVAVAPTGAALICDVNKNGVTIFTTQANRPQVAVGAASGTSATPDVTTWLPGDTLTVDVDQVGSTAAGGVLTVTILAEG